MKVKNLLLDVSLICSMFFVMAFACNEGSRERGDRTTEEKSAPARGGETSERRGQEKRSSVVRGSSGIGATYNARDPQVCGKRSSAGSQPPAEEAEESVICNAEHEVGNESLFLVDEVTVDEIGKGSPYKPGVDYNVDDLDPEFLIYPIRGSLKKYQCGVPSLAEDQTKNCRLSDEQQARGRCYKDTFGAWQCSMSDESLRFSDYTMVEPPQ